MTAQQIYETLKSQIAVSCGNEDVLRKKYGKQYEALRKEFERSDYARTILAEPILSAMPHEERSVFNSTLIKTVPMFTINAYAAKADNGEYLIVLNERLLALICSYRQIQFLSIYNYSSGNNKEHFANNYLPIIKCYLSPESGSALPVYTEDEIPKQMDAIINLCAVANEQFIFAHELAHIFLKHFSEDSDTKELTVKNFLYGANIIEQEKEFAADIQAVKWLHNMASATDSKMPLSMYIEIFVLFHMIECNCGFLNEQSSHPSALDRLKNIKIHCANCFDAHDMEFIDGMIKSCSDTDSFMI